MTQTAAAAATDDALQPLRQAQDALGDALANGDEGAIQQQAQALLCAVQQHAQAVQQAPAETQTTLGDTQRQLRIMLQARLAQTRQIIDALGLHAAQYSADGRVRYQSR